MNTNFSAGLWIFAGCSDRYCSPYSEPQSTIDQIKLAGSVKGLKGIEVIYPWQFEGFTPKSLADAAKDHGLEIISVNPLIWGPRFQNGAFSNPDAAIRRESIDLCKRSIDAAREIGCTGMCLWPGQDGYDYPFQANYQDLWKWEVEGYRQVAEYGREIKVAVEYKMREPRVISIASSAATLILLAEESGCANVGATLDLGHSLQTLENPAAAVLLLTARDRLFNVHLNDNSRRWDDDLTLGSVHLIETIEFFHELNNVGYDGWLSVDITPYREDAVKACQICLDNAIIIQEMAARIDTAELITGRSSMDAIGVQKALYKALAG
jgi:xylose isomerase